jgi:hypothetical protein|nr:hypothetical protein [Kofleriaceae bacterium]
MRRWPSHALALVAGVAASCATSSQLVAAQSNDPARAGRVTSATPAVPRQPPPPPAPPPPLDRDPPRFAARAVATLQAVAAAVASGGSSDCAGAATRLDAVRDQFADFYAADAALLAGRRRELRAAIATRQADLDAAASAIFAAPAMFACARDAAFARALDRAVGDAGAAP